MTQSEEGAPVNPETKKEAVSGEESQDISPAPNEMQKKYDDLNDRFLRLAADFENYQKRISRDLDQRVRFAIEEFAVELLEVADNFERALSAENGAAREGLEQISKLFDAVLERHGITRIDSKGKKFNPAEHEAIAYIPSEHEEGVVIDQVCQGYRMHDKVIRCAKVAVSKGKECE
jgi:molecular chaperone GrpE